ncbi:iron-sulfur cluster assembly protein [Candidatus Bandiella euplotis]|uniref:Iron-sulfur cluster assembly protein domain protein n=1 Tax=Candidatus Bandiella euplotis TaxID=1664265 RepID=A0ABZ0UKK9_9RICK|nr:iron-sulfur cluster assembly protein [Candidatus Bandiella woodruffii]WPX96666.1 Iron-sulfur cluster assembly protein domain protein [Candidatus Bandiella woodruffii]
MELKDFIQQVSADNSPFKKLTAEQVNIIREIKSTKDQIIAVLKLIYDPEIPVNIWDLGLIYSVDVKDEKVIIEMTLTSPTCPVAGILPKEVEQKIRQVIIGLKSIDVHMVWEPHWDKSMMSEEARFILDIM